MAFSTATFLLASFSRPCDTQARPHLVASFLLITCKSSVTAQLYLSVSLSLSLSHSLSLSLARALCLSLALRLSLSRSLSLCPPSLSPIQANCDSRVSSPRVYRRGRIHPLGRISPTSPFRQPSILFCSHPSQSPPLVLSLSLSLSLPPPPPPPLPPPLVVEN